MNLKEFDEFRVSDAISLNQRLNPELFDDDAILDPDVRAALLQIAEDFMEHLGVPGINVVDITISGSNAAYTYTPHSDIDLHIVVDISKLRDDDIYRELFTSKKVVYNDSHNIKIRGYDVELYVEDSKEPAKTLGEYSILKNKWNKFPSRRRFNFDERSTKNKFIKLVQLIELALRSKNTSSLDNVISTIRKYRQAGLTGSGEFSPENLAYKALRSRGIIDKLYKHRNNTHSLDLSLDEKQYNLEESASGYIPSWAEKDDPRFKTGLTVDVKPDSIKKNAKKLGLGNIQRSGIPPTAKSNGHID